MSIIGWLAVGVIAGLIANRIADAERANWTLDAVLGAAGGAGGGFMFWSFGAGMQGFSNYSLVVAGIGAVAVLLSYHALFVYPGDRGN
jgi:uncharacterized membrane protein YeaQ/YmgE (transglycosylase-associated protein family)